MQRWRDKAAALKLMRKLLKKQGFAPDVLVTDKPRSYGAAKSEIGLSARHHQGLRANNRAENSHQPVRRRDRKMQRFKSPDQLNSSCPFTPPSTTRSTSSAISLPAARFASSETKRAGCGGLLPRPEPELELPIYVRPNSLRVTAPWDSPRIWSDNAATADACRCIEPNRGCRPMAPSSRAKPHQNLGSGRSIDRPGHNRLAPSEIGSRGWPKLRSDHGWPR